MLRPTLAALALLPLAAGPAAAQKADPPRLFPPDEATLKQIEAKTAELRKAVAALPKDTTTDDVIADVEVYAKAAEWIVRHGEWFAKDSPRQTLAVLESGLERAKAAAQGKTLWRDIRGKPVVRGFRSRIDGSVQPFAVTLPEGFGEVDRKWRWDVVLHGRDQTLTEVKFIYARENAKPAATPADYVVLEPYGRGNNAYRWAGETDVFEAEVALGEVERLGPRVLRGFSMGGAGTWHTGLHHPFRYAVIGPGAGFTTTRGYIKNLPASLPDYQEACLHIYDAVDYAENAFNVPVVAYSGERDPQKAAADNIEARLKAFKEPVRFTHLVAPGLEHRMPPEWQAKAEAEYEKHLGPKQAPDRIHFVTYTTRYPGDWRPVCVEALDRHYDRAVVDAVWVEDQLEVRTTNVRALQLLSAIRGPHKTVRIDGQEVQARADRDKERRDFTLVKENGTWKAVDPKERVMQLRKAPEKAMYRQGPIDDAFMRRFYVVPPSGNAWHDATGRYASAAASRFVREWDKYFRGAVIQRPEGVRDETELVLGNLVLFGDPASNPMIAKLVDKLPIKWTWDALVVNGVGYDPATHVPVLIYPNPLGRYNYVVINSGHTFHEADLKGTNALLYPRLGDWAVLKPTPTEKDPAAAVVVAAGLFDEFWQFPKK
jgi:hypothetical protein